MSSEVYRSPNCNLLQASKLQVRVSILVQLSAFLQTTIPIRLKTYRVDYQIWQRPRCYGKRRFGIHSSSAAAQYEQTELGGTAVKKIETKVDNVAGTGTFDAYVYIAP